MTPERVTKLFLLADDDRDDAELFSDALQTLSFPVTFIHVENGERIFSWLSSDPRRPDLIFLDLNMPEMNGWQCLSRLKNDIYYESIPVIIYSTSSNPRDKEIAHQMGAAAFFTKPTSFTELKNILGKLSTASIADYRSIVNNS